jgi:hypothetical protein
VKALTQHIKVLSDEHSLTLDDVDNLLRNWGNGRVRFED